ncbi:hypothetical protein BC829DRAFT_432255 [Chytridium lagenaria]|nr:hypothetical protein BC829DRAFT_432255 [Chytridium lagenaria]
MATKEAVKDHSRDTYNLENTQPISPPLSASEPSYHSSDFTALQSFGHMSDAWPSVVMGPPESSIFDPITSISPHIDSPNVSESTHVSVSRQYGPDQRLSTSSKTVLLTVKTIPWNSKSTPQTFDSRNVLPSAANAVETSYFPTAQSYRGVEVGATDVKAGTSSSINLGVAQNDSLSIDITTSALKNDISSVTLSGALDLVVENSGRPQRLRKPAKRYAPSVSPPPVVKRIRQKPSSKDKSKQKCLRNTLPEPPHVIKKCPSITVVSKKDALNADPNGCDPCPPQTYADPNFTSSILLSRSPEHFGRGSRLETEVTNEQLEILPAGFKWIPPPLPTKISEAGDYTFDLFPEETEALETGVKGLFGETLKDWQWCLNNERELDVNGEASL